MLERLEVAESHQCATHYDDGRAKTRKCVRKIARTGRIPARDCDEDITRGAHETVRVQE